MPIKIEIIDNKYLLGCYSGKINPDVIVNVRTEVDKDDRIKVTKHHLIDLTNITQVDLSSKDIKAVAVLNKIFIQKLQNVAVAIVAPTDLTFGLARMWEAYVGCEGIETFITRNRDSAEEWINEKINS